jgi:hypothetical protein
MVTREMWYKWIAKSQGREPKEVVHYMINEVDDPTLYELQIDDLTIKANKKSGMYIYNKQDNQVLALTTKKLQKIVDFLKKNGIVR